jgi:hypothetical protein
VQQAPHPHGRPARSFIRFVLAAIATLVLAAFGTCAWVISTGGPRRSRGVSEITPWFKIDKGEVCPDHGMDFFCHDFPDYAYFMVNGDWKMVGDGRLHVWFKLDMDHAVVLTKDGRFTLFREGRPTPLDLGECFELLPTYSNTNLQCVTCEQDSSRKGRRICRAFTVRQLDLDGNGVRTPRRCDVPEAFAGCEWIPEMALAKGDPVVIGAWCGEREGGTEWDASAATEAVKQALVPYGEAILQLSDPPTPLRRGQVDRWVH